MTPPGDVGTRIGGEEVLPEDFASQAELDAVKEDTHTGLFSQVTMNNWSLYQLAAGGQAPGAPGLKDLYITFTGSNSPFFFTNASTYVRAVSVPFRGTSNVGSIMTVKFVAGRSATGVIGAIRVYDFTNNLVICEITNISQNDVAVVETSAIGNLPANQAIFEIQAKKTAGAGSTQFRLFSALLVWA